MSRIPLFKHTSLGPVTPPISRARFKMGKESTRESEHTVQTEETTGTSTNTLSPSYLAQTSVPSRHIQDPSSSRKLLVLDLNGSLLIRSKRSAGGIGKGKEKADGDHGENITRTRPTHPRPYIPTFREYLSHPRTMSWLDTIVWSSAQPHSVKSMVDKCFPTTTRCLRAVMARDTFGLDARAYGKKSLTVKDLNIVWSKGAFASSPALASMVARGTNEHPFSHSAETTVLVDDSLRKAQMQPWNHICIKEYSSGLRRADLEVWTSLQQPTEGKKKKKKGKKDEEQGVEEVTADLDATVAELSRPQPPGKFDETMLAIIGILERLKHESNVGAWIRSGGLLTGGIVEERSRELPATESTNSVWFDDGEVATAWAAKGKDALQELGIELNHGIDG